ncbi:MAG: ABC transporter substrate-binding protein, partial [Pannonibacter phragmitetus]
MRYRSNLKAFALAMALSSTVLSSSAFAADDSIDVAGPFEIKGADPSLSGNIFLAMDVAETLVNTDQDGRLTPGLAASWAVESDGLVWRFKMQEGAQFHDGTPADAAAAANALNIARGKPGLLQRAPIDAIEADGADLVVGSRFIEG